jgi:hypothetical protein
MGPKPKKGASGAKSKTGEEEGEQKLQALVLADSFEKRFAPFTVEKPRVPLYSHANCDDMADTTDSACCLSRIPHLSSIPLSFSRMRV